MMARLAGIVMVGLLGCTGEQPVPSLETCAQYSECVDASPLSPDERQWAQWQIEDHERCFEFEEDPFTCQRQCLASLVEVVNERPAVAACDPLAALLRQSFSGRAYPTPDLEGEGDFAFSLAFSNVTDAAVTVEIGSLFENRPASVICPRVEQDGFDCDGVNGSRGVTVLSGAINRRGSGLTGSMVLTESDGTVVEWWYTAVLNER